MVEGYLNCIQFLTIPSKAALSICIQVFVKTQVFVFLRQIPRSGVGRKLLSQGLGPSGRRKVEEHTSGRGWWDTLS